MNVDREYLLHHHYNAHAIHLSNMTNYLGQ